MTGSLPIVIRVREAAFDDEDFPLGVIRIAPDKSVSYLNRAIEAMVGGELQVGMQITDLPLDAESRAALDNAIQVRFIQHRGTGYALAMNRQDTGTVVRGRVAAVPEYEADGSLKGSIGFVFDESLDAVATSIYQEMERASDPASLLSHLAQNLRQVLPFDSFMVTALGKDNLHLRSLFEAPDPPPLPSPYRWWPMPEFVQVMLRDLKPGPFDLDALYLDPNFARLSETNEAAKSFRARGFRYSLRLSVRSKGMQVAILSLLRQRGQPPFTESDLRTCMRLPVVDAIAWSMALDEQLQHRFAVDLIASLTSVGDHAMDVAQRLVDQLWEHFKWEHVSLFRVADDRGSVRLVCQAQRADLRLRNNFEQSIEKGLLGRCVRTGKSVNVGNVKSEPDYEPGIDGTKSELVMPLPGAKLRWVLNVESSNLDAFAEEEQHAVQMLLRVTASVLERTAMLELHAAIMDNVGDGVIQTNDNNTIREVNVAFTRLLGRKRDEMVGRDLASFLAVSESSNGLSRNEVVALQPWNEAPGGLGEFDEEVTSLIYSEARTSEVVRFAKADGSTISMLVSTATIPGEFGGKVFIASDLSGKQYLDRVGKLIPVFRQLASEIRIPLASAATFLEMASSEQDYGPAERKELLERGTIQIRKADLSVERVIHAAGAADNVALECTSFDLRRMVQRVRVNLALDIVAGLKILPDDATPLYVSAAYDQLLFCAQSLVSYLLRVQGRDQIVVIETGRDDKEGRVYLALRLEGSYSSDVGSSLIKRPRTADEMVTVESVVPTLMERMGGQYEAPAADPPQFRLVLAQSE